MTMTLDELTAKLRMNPKYRQAEWELEPVLNLGNGVLSRRIERGWTEIQLDEMAAVPWRAAFAVECGMIDDLKLLDLHRIIRALGARVTITLGGERMEVKWGEANE